MELQTLTFRRTRRATKWDCAPASERIPRIDSQAWVSVVICLGLLFILGCRATPPSELLDLDILPLDEVLQDDKTTGELASSDQAAVESPWKAELASDAWVRTVAEGETAPSRRWRHEGIEQLLALDDSPEAALKHALGSDGEIIQANAAIGLAYLGSVMELDLLAAAVDNRMLSLRQRQAAAEALGEFDDPKATNAIVQLIERLGRFDQAHQAAYHPSLHTELLLSLHDWQVEKVSSVFQDALNAPNTESQLVALEAWSAHLDLPLPGRVVSLRVDPNPQIRAAALTAIAAHRVENVERFLESGLRDLNRDVRLAAIAGLGTIGTDTAILRLQRVLHEEPETLRVAAVRALAAHGDLAVLASAAEDHSWRVRQQAARDLSHFATTESVPLANKLLLDSNIEVQQAVVEAVGNWPLDVAGNVLFTAMSSETYRTRAKAAEQMAQRWAPAGEFLVDDVDTQRAEMLSVLRTQWITEFGEIVGPGASELANQATAASQAAMATREPSSEDIERTQLVLQRLNREDISPTEEDRLLAELGEQGPAIVGVLEHLSATGGITVIEEIYRQVLPRVSPLFDAIEGVRDESAVERRAAANQLIEHREQLSASELAGDRLFEQMIIHSDPLVWRSVLLATEQSSTVATTRIVQAAAGHASAEVRRRACEHMARFPRPEYQTLLSTSVTDSDASVVMAAANALEAGEQLEDPQPLRWLLRSDDPLIQLTAATALVRHHDADGLLAMQRLAVDPDPNIRIQVAQRIGRLGQQNLTAILMDMLDDRAVVRRKALNSLDEVQGPDIATAIRAEGHETEQQLVTAWQTWWHTQQRTASEAPQPAQSATLR